MKPANFPARKLARQIRAQKLVGKNLTMKQVIDLSKEIEQASITARGIRTKKWRG